MKNNLDTQYINLLKDILENGTKKQTRNGEVLSVFGRQIRHRMREGFPLLTTKKLHWNSIVTELLWFLQGRTDLKWLLEQGNTIWVGDSYQVYLKQFEVDANNFNGEELAKGHNDQCWGYPLLENTSKEYKRGQINAYLEDKAEKPFFYLTKEEFINKIKTDNEFAKECGSLGKIYGYQWRKWTGQVDDISGIGCYHDQIANLINDLKTNPDSRRLLVSAWNISEIDQMVLPPCHYSFQVYTRELSYEERCDIFKPNTPNFRTETNQYIKDLNIKIMNDCEIPTRAISLMYNCRSQDVPLGTPFNIASYGLLLELLGKMVNMVPDELIGNLGDCHIYTNQIDGVKEQLTREPYELPKLNINTEWWPTESGECGVGPIDAQAVVNGFSNDAFCKCLIEDDIQLYNYKFHPAIKMPLSN